MVKTQVESQIKVRDFTNMSIQAHPSDFHDWSEVQTHMLHEAKATLRAQMEADIGDCKDKEQLTQMREDYNRQEKDLESSITHSPFNIAGTVKVVYNFLSTEM